MRQATIKGLNRTAVKIPNIRNLITICLAVKDIEPQLRAASFHSKLTIMDEPTAALGVKTAQVEDIIKPLRKWKPLSS